MGRVATGAQGLREPEEAGSSGQPARASANRRRSPRGKRARGRRREHRRYRPEKPGGRTNVVRWARWVPLVNVGMKKIREPRNSIAAEKFKVFMIGTDSNFYCLPQTDSSRFELYIYPMGLCNKTKTLAHARLLRHPQQLLARGRGCPHGLRTPS